jgi:uncharacterized protein involved in exopolysaccharide biosynthesis
MNKNNQTSLRGLLSQDEIYLLDFIKLIKNTIGSNILWIFFISIITIVFSFLVYYFTPLEYESKSVVYIESRSTTSPGGAIKDLLIGSVPESNNNSISPENYKSIISSQVFLNDLVEIKFSKDYLSKDSINLLEYFNAITEKDIFGSTLFLIKSKSAKKNAEIKISNQIRDDGAIINTINRDIVFSNQIPPIVQFSDARLNAFSEIKKRIRIEIKDKTLSVFVKMPSSYLSAIIGKQFLERLLIYSSSMQMHKHNTNIEYLEKRLSEAETKYKNAQRKYAGYKDNSLGVIFESAQTNNQILNNEMTVAFNLLNQFAVQLEQAKIDQKKETPYFSILDPITIPSEPLEPNKSSFILRTLVLAVVLNSLFILFKLLKK